MSVGSSSLRFPARHAAQASKSADSRTYAIAGSILTLWQLPAGQKRVAEDNNRNTYVVAVTKGDLKAPRQALIDNGVDVGEIRRSANNEFVWFHDLDGNRFELSRPLSG